MKSYTIQVLDGRTVLDAREAPAPAAGAGQVLVRLRAAGLNRGEFIAAHGLHAKSGAPKPAGAEGAGEIVAVGADVAHLKEKNLSFRGRQCGTDPELCRAACGGGGGEAGEEA